jgi:starvation-inducible DNA-binding protein
MKAVEPKIESKVIKHLQQQLANAFVLYVNYKKYHWETYGPLFPELHRLFDAHASSVLATIDELAERIRMLGGHPISDPRKLVERSRVIVSTAKSTRQMVEESARNEKTIIVEVCDGAQEANDSGDPGSADLFSRLVRMHEKHLWFLTEILKSDDALVA